MFFWNTVLGWLLEPILTILAHFWGPFWRPFWSLVGYHFCIDFRTPKTSKKGGGAPPRPLSVGHAPPPSSDSSPLVKPLRVLIPRHHTHWQSQSFPEHKTQQLPAGGRQLSRLAKWPPGHVATWPRGHVATWPRGTQEACQQTKIRRDQPS